MEAGSLGGYGLLFVTGDTLARKARLGLRWSIVPRLMSLAVASASLALPNVAQARERVRATATAQAIVVKRLSFIKTADLDFGKLVAGNRAGTVTIAPGGARTATGGVTLAGEDGHPATFAGYGYPNQIVNISINTNTGTLRRVSGTETMRFDTFIVGSTPQAQITTAPLAFRVASSSGMFSFPLGATLRINAGQVPGVYTGTFSITLQYQ